MKAGEKNYLKESNGTKANCNANVTQVRKSRIYNLIHSKIIIYFPFHDKHLQIEGNKELKRKRRTKIKEQILLILCSVYSLRIIG